MNSIKPFVPSFLSKVQVQARVPFLSPSTSPIATMQLTSVILTGALFASAALAAPKASPRERATRTRASKPLQGVELTEGTNDANVEYSYNWAGVVIESPPSGATWTAVVASFVVPTPAVPTDASESASSYSGSAWVGIDGDTYDNAILQTGVDFTVTESGSTSYDAWYEWYPDYAYDFSGITIAAGDTIYVSVTSSSSSEGVAVIENETTGETVSKTLTAPESSATLGGQNAEWIVEAYEENGEEVVLPNFGTVTFTDCVATASNGDTEGPTDGVIIEIVSETDTSDILTTVTDSSTEVIVKYV